MKKLFVVSLLCFGMNAYGMHVARRTTNLALRAYGTTESNLDALTKRLQEQGEALRSLRDHHASLKSSMRCMRVTSEHVRTASTNRLFTQRLALLHISKVYNEIRAQAQTVAESIEKLEAEESKTLAEKFKINLTESKD